MRRLLGSWKRLALQLGLLGGIAAALLIGTREGPARADDGGNCPDEADCAFDKPNIMFLVDYSTSMNEIWGFRDVPCLPDRPLTRWQIVVESLATLTQSGSYLSQNTHLALMRFGHDPSPAAGTTIPNDSSGIVDGQALDVPWYDAQNTPWYECSGSEIGSALAAAGPPLAGDLVGIETWTKGALDRAKIVIDQAKADHPQDAGQRTYLNVVVTDGAWTSMDGSTPLAPAQQNPAITAADLFDNDDVPTYVVTFAGDPAAELAGDQLANAGGTGPTALHGDTPVLFEQALGDLSDQIIHDVVAPACAGGLPRVMVLLDASSSMLNVDGGTIAGDQGTTGWDQAREAMAGDVNSFFDLDVVDLSDQSVEDIGHFGLATFGHDGEQKILVDYGPCTKDNFAWALDPVTSCEQPGCDDPWGGPPITWTFKDGMEDPPGFDHATTSHMPSCTGNNLFCAGSGTYTHLGLQLIKTNQIAYHTAAQQPDAEFPVDDDTQYINILITDGRYDFYSTNAQVQTELEQMYAAGITTHVIGFGDGVDMPVAIAQLQTMADWGSGATLDYHDANNQADLEQALATILSTVQFDPCCAFNDCSDNPEPTTLEPDPIPPCDDTTGGSDTTGTSGDTTSEADTTSGSESDATGESDSTSGSDSGGSTTTDEGGSGADEVGDDASGTGDAPATGEDGCNCAVRAGGAGRLGGAGLLLLLGLAGRIRRRRA